ncbi:DUF7096 domain-containing protein [Salinarchaeum laminariae]|uniref:DUF7096 domain-containing protein n=1 Tax=Salinarchaeum laminariae TaxID=869888 RepID=UPI0020BFAF3B|nr:hypothetical protein [Salinarchaeum laminariae]
MVPSTRPRIAVVTCLVLLLAMAAPGAAGPQLAADSPATGAATGHTVQPQPAGDLALPERVVLPGQTSHGSVVIGAEAAAALDGSGANLEGAYQRHLLRERFESADGTAAKRSVLQEAVDDLETDVEGLRSEERSARIAYRNGELSERGFLIELVSIHKRAQELEQTADLIAPTAADGLADDVSATGVAAQIRALQGSLIARQGPVRSYLGDVVVGDSPPQRVYVSVSRNGTVLSMIEDGTYHREANRDDLLVDGPEQGITYSEAFDLTQNELYSQYASNYDFTTVGRGSDGVIGQFYLVLGEGEASYEHGTLRSYIDAVSQNVFWEYQRMELDGDLPIEEPSETTAGNLTLAVQPTYPSGPAKVTVTEDGEPVSNVSVAVGGTPVSRTGTNGTAWVVLPYESPVVSVASDDAAVSTSIEWSTQYQAESN